MEYLQLFDENGKMLDENIERSKKAETPKNKYYMVILAFIQNNEGKFLFQKTSAQKESIIATTGGHVESGDDGLKTVIKEVNEELGIDLDKDEIEFVGRILHDCFAEIYYIQKELDISNLTLQEDEVESVNWYSIDEVYDLIADDKIRKSNIEGFRMVVEYLNKNTYK